jgi:hypothetical protein
MRLKIACTIAISVLHLHQASWVSDQLQRGHFYFIAVQKGFFPVVLNDVGTFVTHPTRQAPTENSSPFDCLRHPGKWKGKEISDASSSFGQQQNSWGLNKAAILEEVNKIPFGRPYRDLVKLYLAGSL